MVLVLILIGRESDAIFNQPKKVLKQIKAHFIYFKHPILKKLPYNVFTKSAKTCLPLIIDTDECTSSETNECDANALCTNTEGSYVCRCVKGFQGDGRNCTGKS